MLDKVIPYDDCFKTRVADYAEELLSKADKLIKAKTAKATPEYYLKIAAASSHELS